MSDTISSPYQGKILRVDLTSGKISKEIIDPVKLRDYLGGAGIGIKILYDEVPPETAPFDSENRLIFASSPLNGTNIPSSGTYTVVTRGPLTGGLVSAQANGYFGARMRHAGYDVIIIQGIADEWKYLYIKDDVVELKDASGIKGMGTLETQKKLIEITGNKKASVASIGPAGENLVKFSAIGSDMGHFAATNGPGAVMGSKKLKAIVLSSDSTKVDVADKKKMKSACSQWKEQCEKDHIYNMIKYAGTHGYWNFLSLGGVVPIKNFTTNEWPSFEKYYGDGMRKRYNRKPSTCWACPLAHTAEIAIDDCSIPYTGEEPEYELLAGFTTNIGNDDIAIGCHLCALVDELGLCGKESTYTVAMAIECYEKGVINKNDTDGLELTWGHTDAVEELLNDIAYKRGFGKLLSDGCRAAAEKIGGEALNCAVYSGLGIAPHVLDVRSSYASMLSLTLSDNGSFSGSAKQDPEVGNNDPLDPFDLNVIASAMANSASKDMMVDCLGTCMFLSQASISTIASAISAATGWDYSTEEYLKTGKRILTTFRAFNYRNGITADKMKGTSKRFLTPQQDGPAAGLGMSKEQHDFALEKYYEAQGWDPKTGMPLAETLNELRISL